MSIHRSLGVTASFIAIAALCGCAEAPVEPPYLPAISPDEIAQQQIVDRDRWRQEYLGDFPNAVVPEIQRVRVITNDEWPDMMATCLTAAGFAATASGDGGLSSTPPEGDELDYGLAAYTCNLKYPINPREMRELSRDQIRYLYDYYTRVATPCLHDLGFTKLPEPPSQEAYISAYPNLQWNIYGTVADEATDEEWEQANDLCPQAPRELFGEWYGDDVPDESAPDFR